MFPGNVQRHFAREVSMRRMAIGLLVAVAIMAYLYMILLIGIPM